MIKIDNISKEYRMGDNILQVLKGVSLSIEDGDFVAIMGPSGSGKSTLMHILGLLDVPDSGTYTLGEKEVSKLSEDELSLLRRQEIGFIFQQFHLLPRLDATENVSLPLLYSEKKMNLERAQKLLEMVGLGPRAHHRPNELSGGQQQRVAIARSLVNQPRMILADEPTGNLDSVSEKEVLEILKKLNAEGITIVIVTHEEEIGRQAKRIIRMRDGVIQSDERISHFEKAQALREEKLPVISSTIKEMMVHFVQSLKTLAGNKVRTALSMLGILIGVAAVVAMMAIGRGAQKSIESQLSGLGSNLLVLRSGGVRVAGVAQEAGASTRLTLEDADYLKENVSEAKEVAPSVNGRAQAAYLNKNWNTQVQGSTANYPAMKAAIPEKGRFFTDDDVKKRTRVAVIGATVVKELFGDKSPLGEMMKINRINFQVIGVLPEKGANGWRDQDDVIVVPITTAMYRLLGKDNVESIEIEIARKEDLEPAQENILNLMYEKKRVPFSQQEEAFQVRNMADIQNAMAESGKTMSLLLASIAAISLVVGGIGIMNIMLVSVTERTKEIGLRKAIGATRFDILVQFLIEAGVVGFIGGVAGVIIGWLLTLIISTFSGWSTYVGMDSVILSFSFSLMTGLLFGIYPARKASLLQPIQALRFE